jgi:hypothetical protein
MVAFCTPLAGFLNSIIYVFTDDDVLKDWKTYVQSIFNKKNSNNNENNSDDSFSGPPSIYSLNKSSVQQYSVNQKESFSIRNSSIYSISISQLVSNNNSNNNSNSNSKNNSKNTSVDKSTNIFYKDSLKKYIQDDALIYSIHNHNDQHLLIKHLHEKLGSPTSTFVAQNIQNNNNSNHHHNSNNNNIDNNNSSNSNNNGLIVFNIKEEEHFVMKNSTHNPILKNNII